MPLATMVSLVVASDATSPQSSANQHKNSVLTTTIGDPQSRDALHRSSAAVGRLLYTLAFIHVFKKHTKHALDPVEFSMYELVLVSDYRSIAT